MTEPRRILLCVGCDEYEMLGELNGAHADASNMYNVLLNPEYGDYPGTYARLLLSPTCRELEQTLAELLTCPETIDTLTIFFAGHGGAVNRTYYLCLKETIPGRFSTSSFSLSRLFEIINEASPAQCNIIIDACHAGSLISDLSTLLKPELIGNANTSGISIFATSAADEYSLDTANGGVGTIQLLRLLTGDITVQNSRPFLDLVEVGRTAAVLIANEAARLSDTHQSPVVWGLNLFGQSRFSKNPAYEMSDPRSIHSLIAIPSRSDAGIKITESADKLWALLYEDPKDLTTNKIFWTLASIMKKLEDESEAVQFISGVSIPLSEKILQSQDSFASIQLNATLIALLLSRCGGSGAAEVEIENISNKLLEDLECRISELIQELGVAKDALAYEGLSDFYFLPIRITKILGWCGAGLLICAYLQKGSEFLRTQVELLCEKVLEIYEACLFVISDTQSPYLLTFLFSTLKFGMREIGEKFYGLYCAQLFEDKALIARANLPSELAYDFVKARLGDELICSSSMVANPSECLSVVLMMAKLFELDDSVDPYLSNLDHTSHVVFIPNTHLHFGQPTIEDGRNHSFQVGHGVWNVDDFVSTWGKNCGAQLLNDPSLNIPEVFIGALCASMIFPDRTPWFLLRTQSAP